MKRTVAILLFDEIEVLDFAGPFEVFAVTNELRDNEAFNVITVAENPGTVRARNGLLVEPHCTLADCPQPDILVVPGGAGSRIAAERPAVVGWVKTCAGAAEIVFSVCTGTRILAAAGLLDGLRVTTHHQNLVELAAAVPTAIVDPSQRFHDTGHIVTSAGISAGIDASLHLVGRLLGPDAIPVTARYMEYGDYA